MEIYCPKNILVTGAAGFIGSYFVDSLLAQYDDVTVVSYDKLTYAADLKRLDLWMSDSRHHFIKGDINDQHLVEQVLSSYQVDTIVHFAAKSHVDNSIASPEQFMQTNVLGTYTLLEAAKNYWSQYGLDQFHCRFHHVSTDEVYGSLDKDASPFTECSRYCPNSPYAASKASSDHIVRAYCKTYGVPTTISHCSNNYGLYQHEEKLIPKIIASCQKLSPITLYGDGQNVRDWLHVTDHCSAINAILTQAQPGSVFNIGGNCEMTNVAIAIIICDIFNELFPTAGSYRDLITYVGDRKGHDFRYAINSSLIQKQLGWVPKENIQEVLFFWIKGLVCKDQEAGLCFC
jgi:dTDP-glucose 4,6-dehydratase